LSREVHRRTERAPDPEAVAALTDLFVRKRKHAGKPSGEKYSDGRALYLLVEASSKYWRVN
jgi:hypothetical protein